MSSIPSVPTRAWVICVVVCCSCFFSVAGMRLESLMHTNFGIVFSAIALSLGRFDQIVMAMPTNGTQHLSVFRMQAAFGFNVFWAAGGVVLVDNLLLLVSRSATAGLSLIAVILCWRDGYGRKSTILFFALLVSVIYTFSISPKIASSILLLMLVLFTTWDVIGQTHQALILEKKIKEGTNYKTINVSLPDLVAMFSSALALAADMWVRRGSSGTKTKQLEKSIDESSLLVGILSIQGLCIAIVIVQLLRIKWLRRSLLT